MSAAQSSTLAASWRAWLLLLVVAGCMFFAGLGRLPLLEPDEGRNAEVAREMLVTHDWVTPHYDSFAYLDKPVVLFWMIAGSFAVLGTSELAARLPSALLATATVLLAWWMGRRMFGTRAGLRAGVILAVSPFVFAFARLVIFDMPLTFLVSVALFCFWMASRQPVRRLGLDALAFAAMGVATLTKGPVGFLLPLITLLVYHALSGQWAALKKVRWAEGWAIFLAIVLPWFIDVSLRNPGFARYALWNESLLRFATGGRLHRSQPAYYYIPVYFGGFFPWSFFLIFAALGRLRKWRALREEAHRAECFLFCWAAVIFVFFSVSHSKLPGYFLPALVPLSLLAAAVWRDADAREPCRAPDWLTAGFAAMILIGLGMAAAAHFLPTHGMQHELTRKLPLSVRSVLKSSVFLGGLIIAALGVLGRNMATRPRRLRWLAFVVVALALPLVALRWRTGLKDYFSAFSSRQLARTLRQSAQGQLPIYGYYYFRTGLPFYLERPVGLITSGASELTSNYIVFEYQRLRGENPKLPVNPAGRDADGRLNSRQKSWPLLMDAAELRRLGGNPPGAFLLIIQNNEIGSALNVAGTMAPLWEAWKYSIWEKAQRPRLAPSGPASGSHTQPVSGLTLGL
ncbi:MAG: ArnT family glycosyltransferase [Terriglobia bacterium]